jgi:hypothetical protein
MKVWTVPNAAKAFPIGAKVKYFLSMASKEDFHEGVVSTKPRFVYGRVAVGLSGCIGAFCVDHLELSE